ncbi:LamG-like jellyroll fold domain-containing protein [Methylobacterium iners]|uniref:LamG-like jellyroll fold domain-containing protein n=1 Tax=Methylobacterium iners TaxID=418707 RepID=A0ABQ4RRF4_9HYPH|nr:LamG-like jellyroll fold domain-containing protein [Methylobacterium iners]GJD92920.1 hypothetical protein OCOJLMKI_0103 [Methylobacterium iners]
MAGYRKPFGGGSGSPSPNVSADGLTYVYTGFKPNTAASLFDVTAGGPALATQNADGTGKVTFVLATKPPVGNAIVIDGQQRVSAGTVQAAPVVPVQPGGVTYLFISTDFITDPDDAVMLVTAIAHKNAGLVVIDSVMASANETFVPAGIDALMRKYGAPVPVYVYKGAVSSVPSGSTASLFPKIARDAFGTPYGIQNNTNVNYPDTMTGWTARLSAVPDQSVLLSIVGSPVDFMAWYGASPANAALAKAKIRKIGQMGGGFPSTSTPETNAKISVAATAALAAIRDIPIEWSGVEIGATVRSGPPLYTDPTADPLQAIFDQFEQEGSGTNLVGGLRQSYDPLSLDALVRGLGDRYTRSAPGIVNVDASGNTSFAAQADGNHTYLVKAARGTTAQTDALLGAELNAIVATVTAPIPASVRGLGLDLNEGTPVQFVRDPSYKGAMAITGANAATTTNDPTRATAPNGTSSVFQFSGAQYLESRDPLLFTGNSLAVGAVINPDAIAGTGLKYVLAARTTGSGTPVRYWELALFEGRIRATVWGNVNGTSPFELTADTALPVGTWALVQMHQDGTTLRIRLNGVEAKPSIAATLNTATNVCGVQIGAQRLGSIANFYNGKMAAFDFLAGTNLTVAQALAQENKLRAIATAKGITLP